MAAALRRIAPSSYRPIGLKQIPPAHLELPRLTEPASDGAVEVVERALRRGVLEVVRVGNVKCLEDHLECPLPAQIDGLRQPDVPREVCVVLADGVPAQDVAIGADPEVR